MEHFTDEGGQDRRAGKHHHEQHQYDYASRGMDKGKGV
jgi:hypothetical protein